MSRISPRTAGALAVLALIAAACGSSSKSSSSSSLPSATLNASGSTFQKPFNQDQIQTFTQQHSNVTINYAGGGSGKGRQDLADQVVDWAGTDAPIPASDVSKFKGGTVLYFPTVVAPITVSYHLSGVSNLAMSADTVAKIFSRQVKTWDDPAIKADNPSVSLPSTAITVVHRSDGSGTTQNFTKYLTKAAPTVWTLGSGTTVNWPADTQTGNGNAGVAQVVKATDGAVGYVDYADAKTSQLSLAGIKTSAGVVQPTLEGASNALKGITINADLTYDPINSQAAGAYPITSPTWIIAYKTQTDKNKGEVLKAFLTFLLTDGQKTANDSEFAPLSSDLASKALAQVNQITVPA
jgi:phosphate transport system substrate-binding protein